MESLKGKVLVSGGGLYDPNFRHTVVLIGEHDSWGAVGVVLNRPLATTVGEAAPPLAELVGGEEVLFHGGPVEPEQPVLLVEVDDPALLDVRVFGSVGFITGEIPTAVAPHVRRARVFAGHSGWGPGQLESEMQGDSWIVDPATDGDVFTDSPESLWRRILERKGPDYATIARIPFDPSMN